MILLYSEVTLFAYLKRGKGIAMYYNLDDVEYQHICQNPCQMSKSSVSNYEIFVIYRPHTCLQTQLLALIEEHVSVNTPTLLCGDFNLDVLKIENNLNHDNLHNKGFTQVISTAIHILGESLDHVYTNTKPIDTMIHPVYYSDHDATCIILS